MEDTCQKREFYYPSSDGITQIHAIFWQPKVKMKAVIQICHGMQEYIDRYHDFAVYLAGQGYCVVGNDHLGHGKSVASKEEYGFFRESSGNEAVIADIHSLRKLVQEKLPNLPYFMMGHSMGSFLVRQYITRYSEGLSGTIIMGTGSNPDSVLSLGKALCKVIAGFRGWHYKSRLVDNMAAGGFNKEFKNPRTNKDWLSRNEENVDAYLADEMCGHVFTVNAYYGMFTGIKDAMRRENMEKIRKDLPLYFVSGSEDPVGNHGKGVDIAFQQYEQFGFADMKMKLYPADRHEILKETDRDVVYKDILNWLDEHLATA